MHRRLRLPWRASLVVTLFITGCGVDYRTAPVSGRVTLDGQPLAGASVTFQPMAKEGITAQLGMGSYGKTDADGRYSLKLIETDAEGAAVGTHRVQVSLPIENTSSDTSGGGVTDKVPARYRGPESELIVAVPKEGTTTADLKLESKP
jgi:hypothetical protein